MNLQDVKTYEAAVAYCLEIPRFTGKNNMDITRAFYAYLDKPGSRAKIVHVAGTNGKGSVCAFLQSICLQMQQKVGMFTSPHLCDIRERVRVDGECIKKEEFLASFLSLAHKLFLFCDSKEEYREYHPSFFEWLFFIGMLCFEKEKTDVILLETGLGGRLDATNCIDNPALCIITKIGYDHMEYLGDTIEQIAAEKAGIIKPQVPVVYLQDKESADRVIEKKAYSLSSPLYNVSKTDADMISFRNKHIDFSYKSRYYGYVRFTIGTTAFYQVENAIVAICAAEVLWGGSEPLSEDLLQKGILAMHWDGRMEEVLPHVFLDGAHNEDGIDAFLESVSRDACQGSRMLLFSVVCDKQYDKMGKKIMDSGLFSRIYTAPVDNARGVGTEKLEQIFADAADARHVGTPQEALREMLKDRGALDFVYVAGSLYLVGQLKEWLESENVPR